MELSTLTAHEEGMIDDRVRRKGITSILKKSRRIKNLMAVKDIMSSGRERLRIKQTAGSD
jgi:hypothetical protein